MTFSPLNYVPPRVRPWLRSIFGGSFFLLAIALLDRSGAPPVSISAENAGPVPPAAGSAPSVTDGQAAVVPAAGRPAPAPVRRYNDEGEFDDEEGGRSNPGYMPSPAPVPTPAPTPAPTPSPVPASPAASGLYKDGKYSASSSTPWGLMSIRVTASGGRWTNVDLLQVPNSPPLQYAAGDLARQALTAQSAAIDGVTGATYASDAFRDDLRQIVSQSKR